MPRSVVLLLVTLSLGCATKRSTSSSSTGTPEWIAHANRYDLDDTEDCARSRFGVGGLAWVKSKALLHSAAVARARADMSARLRACWSKRLEDRFQGGARKAPESGTATLESTLEAIVSRAIDSAVVVHRWQPDGVSEWVYIEAPAERARR